MANALYPKWGTELQKGSANTALTTGATSNVKAVLVQTSGAGTNYTYASTHQFLSDVASGARVATSAFLTNLTIGSVAENVVDADDFVWSSVATGEAAEAIIFYIDTGTASTSKLIAYYDTSVTGLPVTPNSGNINVQINASGLWKLY
jgi:hypothetical protein